VLLPPTGAEPGDVWIAPLDGAVLVFHPAMAIRLGCSVSDGACRDNEIIFRWVEVPALWVESREVTNRRYRLCVAAGACDAPAEFSTIGDADRQQDPVTGVTWLQARAFARWAGRRLPSEAEWERAARGEVTDARFPWGDGRRRGLANVWQDPRFGATPAVAAVASYPATGFGLWDMAGNVWEWCQDRYQPRFSDASLTGGAARSGLGRVVRGGSWRRAIDMARVSTRSWYDADYAADDVGFRCVVSTDRDVLVDELVRTAGRAFPNGVAAGTELSGAGLEPEDRRFLERRAITLYVVEGRLDDALSPAAIRLASDPDDPVALDVFDRFETTLFAAATGDSLDDIRPGLEAYRRAVVWRPELSGRLLGFEEKMVTRLRRTVSTSRARGADDLAFAAAEVGLSIVPGDAIFAAAVDALARSTGSVTVWPRDGKGMVWVTSQSYTFGASPGDLSAGLDEEPRVEVEVGGFWIDRTEVTNDEYRGCVRAGACSPPHRIEVFDDPRFGSHPVTWVDWFQARAYAAWAGKRLPSETEWELAARAGSEFPFPWGIGWEPGRANAMGAYRRDVWHDSAPVASFAANRWGIYDLVGNAAEWVDDVYQDRLDGVPLDGRARFQENGPAGERRRVVRGGGYDEPPPRQRVSRRSARRPDDFDRSVGFRCVADDD
jgi:formylglycine-generating enzyme required for sulfatase activity